MAASIQSGKKKGFWSGFWDITKKIGSTLLGSTVKGLSDKVMGGLTGSISKAIDPVNLYIDNAFGKIDNSLQNAMTSK